MEIYDPIVLDESFNNKLDEVNRNLFQLCINTGGSRQFASYKDIQNIVRQGYARDYFKDGDDIKVHSSDLNLDVMFRVVHIFDGNQCGALKLHDPSLQHGMILHARDVLYYGAFPFSPKQALYYCENGLSAGPYHFTITQHSWVSSDINKVIQFTLTQPIPAGGQLVVQQNYNVSFVNAKINSYSSALSNTVIESVTMTEGNAGTDLGNLANAINGNMNSCQRALLGNNRYSQSYERLVLNSSGRGFYTPQSVWDRPTSWGDSHDGLLSSLDSEFIDVLADVDVTTILNTVSDGGGTEVITDKLFLPNRIEMFMTAENSSETGVAWDYYKNFSDYQSPNNNADSNRIKMQVNTQTPRYYWLRTPYAGGARTVRTVITTGAMSDGGAVGNDGCAPACIIA